MSEQLKLEQDRDKIFAAIEVIERHEARWAGHAIQDLKVVANGLDDKIAALNDPHCIAKRILGDMRQSGISSMHLNEKGIKAIQEYVLHLIEKAGGQ
jgi:hypothetical protein